MIRSLLPIIDDLAISHPRVSVVLNEAEPDEARASLVAGRIDLALTYDYTLAPAAAHAGLITIAMWETPWSLGVPTTSKTNGKLTAPDIFALYRDSEWIGNPRNVAGELVVRAIASRAGFEPHLTHTCDSLDLVEDLIVAGMGVGFLPADRPARPGITLLPLLDPDLRLRASAVVRDGHVGWPPLRLILDRLAIAG